MTADSLPTFTAEAYEAAAFSQHETDCVRCGQLMRCRPTGDVCDFCRIDLADPSTHTPTK